MDAPSKGWLVTLGEQGILPPHRRRSPSCVGGGALGTLGKPHSRQNLVQIPEMWGLTAALLDGSLKLSPSSQPSREGNSRGREEGVPEG